MRPRVEQAAIQFEYHDLLVESCFGAHASTCSLPSTPKVQLAVDRVEATSIVRDEIVAADGSLDPARTSAIRGSDYMPRIVFGTTLGDTATACHSCGRRYRDLTLIDSVNKEAIDLEVVRLMRMFVGGSLPAAVLFIVTASEKAGCGGRSGRISAGHARAPGTQAKTSALTFAPIGTATASNVAQIRYLAAGPDSRRMIDQLRERSS
ncbi:hypothetical protein [Rhodococcus globerulus]|uniref:hypothetical protein n=1 Tax=Rhodococcus globerulus TaxID=33008 RepID=UPI003017526C